MDTFEKLITTLEPRKPVSEIYSAPSDEPGEAGEKEGKVLVKIPVEEEAGHSLVFEFSCRPLLEVYNSLSNWTEILERMLNGLDGYAFVKTGGDNLIGYPLDDFTNEEKEEINKEASEIFKKSDSFIKLGVESSYKPVSFRQRLSLAMLLPYPQKNADFLLIMPLVNIINTGLYCAVALSVFIIYNLILFLLYALKLSGQREHNEEREALIREARKTTRPGRLLLLFSVAVFSLMLLMLESRATIAYIGATRRVALEYEIERNAKQSGMIRKAYSDIYLTRAKALAEFLTQHKEYRTRSELKELSDTLKAEYLMLFDENGNEIIASNSYTGFSVSEPNANLSEEYRAVLLGYPSVMVGPENDPYTNKQQIGAATLFTKENGEADGFLLAVFDAAAMNAELAGTSLENTVNKAVVTDGYKAAVIRNEDGQFIANTDENKIGLSAEYYITTDAYGDDYEGFTEYDGNNMYVSGVSDGVNSLLFMVPERSDNNMDAVITLMIAALLAIIAFLYCPKACELCATAMNEAMEKAIDEEYGKYDKKNALLIFGYGYVSFLTVMAGITFITAVTMIWPAFTFVFGGFWSRGVHLFSLWAALYFMAVTVSVELLLRLVLRNSARQADLRTRTVLKLTDSFVAYATVILLLVVVLYMFGVNTVALIASAGIVSIAVGMGAKDMVSDILAGLFLAVEDSVHMGDEVSVGSWKGRVTNMGIRTTEITDENQHVKIMNNSRINDVVNMSRQKTSCVLELVLKCSGSREEIEKLLAMAVETASDEMPQLYGSLQLEGIKDISKKGCTVSLSYICAETARESVTAQLKEFMEQQFCGGGTTA
jgi:small conductance mechanosensitive channel